MSEVFIVLSNFHMIVSILLKSFRELLLDSSDLAH